ncbi:hypothetical protein [Nocardia sp. NPDC052112]|uniref:hypothetical protein n=1 Tax=Nocardia sp. NPDC052112 TaxID=3155646 RepID=UPI003418B631
MYLRGTFAGTHSLVIRKGPVSRFVGPAFRAADAGDLDRLARSTGTLPSPLRQPGGGKVVSLWDPNGMPVRVVHGTEHLPALPEQQPLSLNVGVDPIRINTPQRPPREPACVQRLKHLVKETRTFNKSLGWYLDTLGMIVSDFMFLDSQRDRGPVMAFVPRLVSSPW